MGDVLKDNVNKTWIILVIFLICSTILVNLAISDMIPKGIAQLTEVASQKNFSILISSENKDLEGIINNFANENNIKMNIEYAGTIEMMDKLNNGEKYDAIWTSNSIWIYMLNNNISVKNSKSTSINPVVFGITKSKAEELGFTNKEVYTNDIIQAINNKQLKFNMSSATQTNTGATAYLSFVSALAGNPEVLKSEDLEQEELKTNLTALLSAVERSSGSDEFIEESFLKGNYEAVVTYESSIININKKLQQSNKEPLYAIYPIDGVAISDSPLAYIDNKDTYKSEVFEKLQSYILGQTGQKQLEETGRRVWFGGVNANADKNVFNPDWGIDTTKYVVPVKYPSTAVIKKALGIYQTELRKPSHIVFCLDYSGSMYGEGISQLKNAMEYILTEEKASVNLLQFAEKDKITIIPFSSYILNTWNTTNGLNTGELLRNINKTLPNGGTNIYLASEKALDVLKDENMEEYSLSIVLMTDGMSNSGSLNSLKQKYKTINKDIPIFSIMFGDADSKELESIADLTNAKVFDGRTNLLSAFKQVRGYN